MVKKGFYIHALYISVNVELYNPKTEFCHGGLYVYI